MSNSRQEDENRPPRDKAKNGRTSIANRDQPVFSSRRQYRGSVDLPEFYTDSLNTSFASHIPSPSPARPTYGGRARRGNNGRGLAAAYTSLGGNENDTASNTSSPTRSASRRSGQRTRHLDSPQREPGRKSRSPFNRNLPSRNGTKTPSPQRRQHDDFLVSPASDSSPPHGLAEAYRRIQDEEILASQEEEENEDTEGEIWDVDERVLREVPNGQARRSLNSATPESRRSSRKLASPLPDVPQPAPEASNTKPVANSTEDELDRASRESSPFIDHPDDDDMSSRYERDEIRVSSTLSNHDQPFKKARRKPRTGLTLDNLRRNDSASQSGSNSTGSHSISSKASDLSLNIPPNWGRKGRTTNSWLDRITEDSNSKVDTNSKADEQGGPKPPSEHSDPKADSIEDWVAATTTPLPESNSESLLSDGSRSEPAVPPTLSVFSDSRMARARSSTPTNTPPPRLRNAALDAIRAREIETLKEQGLTNNRLGELKAKRSLERVARRSASNGSLAANHEQNNRDVESEIADEPTSEHQRGQSSTAEFGRRIEPLLEGSNGQPLADTPIVVCDPGSAATNPLLDTSNATSQRPGHTRTDSRDVLRTLSRLESNSPSPNKDNANGSATNGDEIVAESSRAAEERALRRRGPGLLGSFLRQPTTANNHSTNNDKSESCLNLLAQVNETPTQPSNKPRTYLKTPLVTGAWIETPLPLDRRSESTELLDAALASLGADSIAGESILVHNNKEIPIPPRLEDTAPKLPGSALADIIQRAKAKNQGQDGADADDTLQLDDSDIESLEALVVGSDKDEAEPKEQDVPEIKGKGKERELNNDQDQGQPSGRSNIETNDQSGTKESSAQPNDDDGLQDPDDRAKAYSNLASKLTHLQSSIHDANKDVSKLQRTISESGSQKSQRSRRASASSAVADADEQTHECTEGGELHDFVVPCEKCAQRQAEAEASSPQLIEWQIVRLPGPRLWNWPNKQWPRLTKIGASALVILFLVILEYQVSEAYTPPFYAESMYGFGVDYDMPRPPYILAKLAWRNCLSRFLLPVWHGLCILIRTFTTLFGISPGIFGHPDMGSYGTVYHGNAFAEEIGIGADEFI